jgi:glycosyltransferase involved in cell wall biosynthesis
VITGTVSGKTDIVSFYGVDPENVVIVPLPVHPNIANGRKDIDVRKKYGLIGDYVFYPAQFWRMKNHVNLLLAIDRLRRRNDFHIKLVLAGSDHGNREHVLNVATELDLLKELHILDFVPQEELGPLYREATALVYPSLAGPDNLPPLEAFSVGCPVAAAAIRGANEQMVDAALWFDPTKPDEIASAIVRIFSDKNLRAQLIRRGYDVASRRSPDEYVARITQVLNELEPVFRCWRRGYGAPSSGPVGAGRRPVSRFDAKSARVARPEPAYLGSPESSSTLVSHSSSNPMTWFRR